MPVTTKENDKTVPIPAAVSRNAKLADDLQKQHIDEMNGVQPQDPPADPQEPPIDPPQDPPQDPPLNLQPPEPPVPPAPPPPTPPDDDSVEAWKHRYLSMKGRYDADIPRLKSALKQTADQVTNLNQLLATVQTKPAPAVPPKEATFQKLITPEEETEYGPEFMDFLNRAVKQQTAAQSLEIERLQAQINGAAQQVHMNTRANLLTMMDTNRPEWRALNQDETFVEWLQLPDPYSGAIRHELLKSAFERNDYPRFLAFFNGFLAEQAAIAAPQDTQPAPTPTQAPKIPLQNLAAPGRAKSTAAPKSVEKPIITRAQIAKFYTDVAAGKWRGREAEAKTFEADLFAAQQEGRIQ